MSDHTVSIDDARQLVERILLCHTTTADNARSVAEALIAAEMDGQRGHGLSRVPSYAAQAASGKVDGAAQPVVSAHKGSAIRVDAANGFAYPAFDLAIAELQRLTTRSGVAAAAVFRSHHFGQAGYHAERLAQRGLLGLVFGNSPKAIAPWGGHRGLFGTNPIAFAAPRRDDAPLLIDLSLSKVARGKVMLAHKEGRTIPDDWALDTQGRPTTDPAAALDGTMRPMGDAKGAALVLMVEVLAAGLTGAHFGYEASSFFTADGAPPGVGQLIVAFDPDFMSGGGFVDRLEELAGEIQSQAGVRLPGARRAALRAEARDKGLIVPGDLMDELRALDRQ